MDGEIAFVYKTDGEVEIVGRHVKRLGCVLGERFTIHSDSYANDR